MEKINLLVTTGKLEIIFEGREELLEELKEFTNSVLEEDVHRSAIRFGRLSKKVEATGIECSKELKELYTAISVLERKAKILEFSNIPIEDLLHPVTVKHLKLVGIKNVGDITERTEKELMSIRNLGKKSFIEIISCLKKLGIVLDKE